jgi:two-component system response regulator AtoC
MLDIIHQQLTFQSRIGLETLPSGRHGSRDVSKHFAMCARKWYDSNSSLADLGCFPQPAIWKADCHCGVVRIDPNNAMPFYFGVTAKMKDLERQAHSIAQSELPVLIEGESGTGKDALAEYLHSLNENSGEFVRYFCRPPAAQDASVKLSRLCRTATGTLLLKHVNLLSSDLQEQFLAWLEHCRGRGARLISSAPVPVESLVRSKQFEAGLYYRLSAFRMQLPALRERAEDTPELFSAIASRAAADADLPFGKLPARFADILTAYAWPGNLRELANVARMYGLSKDRERVMREFSQRSPVPGLEPLEGEPGMPLKEQVKRVSRRLESEIILRTLEQHRWNRRRAARSLQISYRALLYKMKTCDIRLAPEVPDERTAYPPCG